LLKFDNEEVVSGMISPEKEEVIFSSKVNVNEGDNKGNVEKWLLIIEELMIKALKDICHECLVSDLIRTKWI